MPRRIAVVFAALGVVAMTSGCALLYDVSRSLSKSISTPFRSLSQSSQDLFGTTYARYGEDVRVWSTTAATRAELEPGFVRELGRIAEQHGISHWEAQPVSFRALGVGLREAGLSEGEVEQFLARVGRSDDRVTVLEGYRQAL